MSGLDLMLNIAGGVALLLWAARMVRTGIERAYGASLRRTLSHAVQGRWRAFGAGVGVALALQSATATALLTMSFVGSGLMLVGTGVAVMLGADVGSAVAVQVLSLDLRWLSPLLLVAGVALFLSTGERRPRQIGRTLVGLGLLLLALSLIGDAGAQMGESATLATVLGPLAREPALAFLAAALITWATHSSVVTVLLIASLAGAGIIEPMLALALVLGANAGAALIPLLFGLGNDRHRLRIPLANLLFRGSGAVAVLLLLPHLEPHRVLLGGETLRQVVHFHLAFNLALAAFFLPFTGMMARLTERLLPEHDGDAGRVSPLDNPSRLDRDAIDNPRLALASATREVLRMADWVEAMLRRSLDVFRTKDKAAIEHVARMDDRIDELNTTIKHYLIQVSRKELDEEDSARCMEIAAFTVKLEHIGDIVEKNLLELARKRLDADRRFSAAGWEELTDLHGQVIANLQLALNVFVSGDVDTARQLIREKEKFRALEQTSSQQHMDRLREGSAESIDSSPIHLDVIRDLAQINTLLASIAYPILEQSGYLLDSRLRSTAASTDQSAVAVEASSRPTFP